jgi:hypothetical protein
MKVKKLLNALAYGRTVLVYYDDVDETDLTEEFIKILIDNQNLEQIENKEETLERNVKSWKLFLPVDGIDCPTLDIYTR